MLSGDSDSRSIRDSPANALVAELVVGTCLLSSDDVGSSPTGSTKRMFYGLDRLLLHLIRPSRTEATVTGTFASPKRMGSTPIGCSNNAKYANWFLKRSGLEPGRCRFESCLRDKLRRVQVRVLFGNCLHIKV